MEVGATLAPLLGPPVGATRSFRDWMATAEQVCTTLERAGFRYVVLTHSYQYGGMQPLVTLARLAPATGSLRMATQVLLLPLLNAADVAYNVATLDHICEGRLDLGIGLAYHHRELELAGLSRRERVAKFEESLEVMRQFWKGEAVHHDGRYYRIHGAQMSLTPYQRPHPPIWMACTQEDTFRLAGELGVGCLVNTLGGLDKTQGLIETYFEAVEDANPVGHFVNKQVVASTIGFCDENNRRAIERGADVAAWYLNQSKLRFTLEWNGVDPDSVPADYQFYAQGGARRDVLDPQQQAPPTPEQLLAGGGYCVGDPDACIRVIEAFEAMGVDEIMPIFQAGHASHDEIMNSIRLFGKYVIPHFREKEKRRHAANSTGSVAS